MKNIKKVLALLLAVIMTVGTVATVGAATLTFTDTEGHWAWTEGYIPYLVEKEVLNGYKKSENSYYFKPDGEVTRAEFIKMLDEAFGLTETKAVSYSDVKSSDWFCVYFQKAAAQGYILNYGTSADPNGKITREEALSLLVRYLRLDDTKKASASTFMDFDTIDTKYQDYILEAIYAGLTDGYKQSNGSYLFKPKNTLTRAEALTILYRAAGCIYNKDSYVRDAGAAETNNVITKGGISISDQTLSGRTIISEGASENIVSFSNCNITGTLYIRGNSKVYLDKCKVENVVVTGKGGVSLMNTTTVDNLSISYKTQINVMSGNKIKTLTVDATSTDATVIGEGTIDKIVVKGHGFASTIVPADYELGKGITATFGGKEYSESKVEDDGVYVVSPYSIEKDGNYYIECTPKKDGTIYYYYTNSGAAPSKAEFDILYAKAEYKNYFSVKKDAEASQKTFKTSEVKDYSSIVIMLQIGNERLDPIVISNSSTADIGFIVAPAISATGLSVTFKAAANGTVSYYYTNKADKLSQAQFLKTYEACESSIKGSMEVKQNVASEFALNATCVANYDYIAIQFKNANGTVFAPVILAIADDGFKVFPYVRTSGSISFKTDVSGIVYFYYSKTDSVPTSDEFSTKYSAASYRGDPVSVLAGVTSEIKYKPSYASTYPYVIIALRDANGKVYLPVCITLGYESGFSSLPKMTGENTVSFTPETNGTVKYYFTDYETAPTAEGFEYAYNSISDTEIKGKQDAYLGIKNNITVPAKVTNKQYIIIMLTDKNGITYAPISLSLKYTESDSITGFKTTPYIKDGYVYFTPVESGTLYYYYIKEYEDLSPAQFNYEYYIAEGKIKDTMSAVKNVTDKIQIRSELKNEGYNYIVLSLHNDVTGVYSEPVVLNAFKNTESSATTTGFSWEVDNVTFETKVTPTVSGTLYYFQTDSAALASAEFDITTAGNTIAVTAGSTYRISSENKKYVVMCLVVGGNKLTKAVVNPKKGEEYTGGVYDDDHTTAGTNFSFFSYSAGNTVEFKTASNCNVYFTLVDGNGNKINYNIPYMYCEVSSTGNYVKDLSAIKAYIESDLKDTEHVNLYIQCRNISAYYTSQAISLK